MLVNLNDVLKDAQNKHYAVGLFNTTDTDMLQSAIEAAEEEHSPIIIGTAEVLLPYGELKLIAPSIVAQAKSAKVPIVVHFDHGLTVERCKEALDLGFTSIMFDASNAKYSQNIRKTKDIAEYAHNLGASIEGEIGHVGEADCKNQNDRYTTVDEAEIFAKYTDVDALAIAIGTAHGAYKTKPCLDLQRLQDIRNAIETPLVLHGGSGLTDNDFRNVVKYGISKINIFTDLTVAGISAMKSGIESGLNYLEIRNLKKDYIKQEIKNKIRLFGSNNRY